MDVEFTELLFNCSVQCLRPRSSANLQLRFAQVLKPLSAKVVSIRFDGQECIDTSSMIMTSDAEIKFSLKILDIEHERVSEKTRMQTESANTCPRPMFPQLFRVLTNFHECFITR